MGYILLLLSCHMIGDFYLQGNWITKTIKHGSLRSLVRSAFYIVPFLILWVSSGFPLRFGAAEWELVLMASCWLLVVHFLIDGIRRQHEGIVSFCISQCVQLIVLIPVWYFTSMRSLLPVQWCALIFLLLFIFKPSGVIVSKALAAFDNGVCDKGHHGKWIGYLERTVVLILCYLNAFVTVGLVVIAKILVCYKQIGDTHERYLFGTLLSLILAFAAYGVVRLVM